MGEIDRLYKAAVTERDAERALADDLADPITDDEIRAALVDYADSFQHDALAVVRALRGAGIGVVRAVALARYREARNR